MRFSLSLQSSIHSLHFIRRMSFTSDGNSLLQSLSFVFLASLLFYPLLSSSLVCLFRFMGNIKFLSQLQFLFFPFSLIFTPSRRRRHNNTHKKFASQNQQQSFHRHNRETSKGLKGDTKKKKSSKERRERDRREIEERDSIKFLSNVVRDAEHQECLFLFLS